MEKLIELLNKHRREKVNKQSWITEWHYNAFTFSLDNISWQQAELLIISKQYWFIKWLVENDKIDTSKANDKNLNGYEIELRIRAVKELVADSEEKTVLYLNLLMLLSISDTPIEDLISYLK
jgi:hypothetical protein